MVNSLQWLLFVGLVYVHRCLVLVSVQVHAVN